MILRQAQDERGFHDERVFQDERVWEKATNPAHAEHVEARARHLSQSQ